MKRFLIVIALVSLFINFTSPINAYYKGMNASVVVGQPNFTSTTAAITQNTLSGPSHAFIDPRGRLIVSEFNNSRVLIWNSVPTQNGVAADLVLGQNDFTSSSSNKGGSAGADTLSNPSDIYSNGTKLFIGDSSNNRVLIWNTFPTINDQPADVVVGKSSMSDGTSITCDQNTVGAINGMAVYDNKLIIQAANQRRILIWNSIPTTNGAAADVVVGKPDFVSCGGVTATQTTILGGLGLGTDPQGRLIVTDNSARRVLIWNKIPTNNLQPADVVLGQTNFTNSDLQTISSSTLGTSLRKPASDGKRLFVADGSNNRILMWSSFPTTNGQPADQVFGQPDFVSGSVNAGGSASASTLSGLTRLSLFDKRLVVADANNNRVLIFDDIVSTPAMNINPPISIANKIRIAGNVSLGERPNYSIQKVTASINGENETNVTYLDGGRDNGTGNTLYEFYNDFIPTNRGGDPNNYTVAFRTQSIDGDEDKVFYFTPFSLDKVTIENLPTISFTVNQTFRDQLKNNLIKYQVWYKKTTDKDFKLYLDNILTSQENNGNITVKGVTKLLPGKYQLQIKAINIMGREQQSNVLNISVKLKK